MTFDSKERSSYDGIPTMLYEFSLADTYWRYAAGDASITLGGVTYSALAIASEGYSSSGNPDTDEMVVRLSAYADVTQIYVGTPPSDVVRLVIRTLHRGDTDAPVVWAGQVKSGRQVSTVEFAFTCNSILSTLNRNGLRLSWGRGCPHALYDRSCRVNPADFATAIEIEQVSGNTIVSSGFAGRADGYFSGGFIVFTSTLGAIERRAIKIHAGNAIALLGASDGLEAGMAITAHPGCDRVTATCEGKFNNLPNYGGFPHLPTKSPFDGDPIF